MVIFFGVWGGGGGGRGRNRRHIQGNMPKVPGLSWLFIQLVSRPYKSPNLSGKIANYQTIKIAN